MSKEEFKAQKAKEFWERLAPYKGSMTLTAEYLLNDDCLTVEEAYNMSR